MHIFLFFNLSELGERERERMSETEWPFFIIAFNFALFYGKFAQFSFEFLCY